MTSKTTDFYIDSGTYQNPSNFILDLPHPINIPEQSKAYITIKNFTALNSIYNISEDLLNNKLKIVASRNAYQKTKSGSVIYLFNQATFFQQANPNIYLPLAGIISWANQTETLTTSAYNIYFKTSIIQTTNTNVSQTDSIIRNIFDETIVNTTHYFKWKKDSSLIIKKNSSISNGDFLQYIVFGRYYTKPGSGFSLPTANSERIRVYGSHDGLTWIEATYGAGNIAITWSTEDLAQANATKTYSVALDWLDDYIYYKIQFESEQDPDMYYSYFQTTKCYFLKFPTTEVVYQYPFFASNTLTIPDGNYSITTLLANLNDLILTANYNNVKVAYIAYNNKLTITSTESPYAYSALNKIDTQVNLEFIFSNKLKKMLGITNNPNIQRGTNITAPNFINLLSFKKILITSNLKLTNKPITSLSIIDKSDGVGDVLVWIDRDVIPFEYINWSNGTDYKLQIDNKNIANINFKITNEFGQMLTMPSCLLYFEITVIDEK
jgi:hypothetical protein